MKLCFALLVSVGAFSYGPLAEDVMNAFNQQGRQTPFIFTSKQYLSHHYIVQLRERLKSQFPNIKINLIIVDRLNSRYSDAQTNRLDIEIFSSSYIKLLTANNYYNADAIYVFISIEDRQFISSIDKIYNPHLTAEKTKQHFGSVKNYFQQGRFEEGITAFFKKLENDLYAANKILTGSPIISSSVSTAYSSPVYSTTTLHTPYASGPYLNSHGFSGFRSRISRLLTAIFLGLFLIFVAIVACCVLAVKRNGRTYTSEPTYVSSEPRYHPRSVPLPIPVPVNVVQPGYIQNEVIRTYPVGTHPNPFDPPNNTAGITTGTTVVPTNNPRRPQAAFDTVKGTW